MEPTLGEPMIHQAVPRNAHHSGKLLVLVSFMAAFCLTVFLSVAVPEPSAASSDLDKTTFGKLVSKPSHFMVQASANRPSAKFGSPVQKAQTYRPVGHVAQGRALQSHPVVRAHAESPLVKQTLLSTAQNVHTEQWSYSGPSYSVKKETLHGGKQEGVDVITVDNGLLSFTVVPTRGMNVGDVIVKDSKGSYPLGWKSPVSELVHPKHIKLDEFGGLGMLQGFTEQMFRGGFAFIGHPAKDGDFNLPLHGRAHNIPASEVEVIVEPEGRIRVRGRVDECMFKFCDFEMWTEISTAPGSDEIQIKDTLTNRADYEKEYQVLYHTNFGPGKDHAPLLEEGASFLAPVAKAAPMYDGRAVEEVDSWDKFKGPTKDFNEAVYCVETHGDASGKTVVALVNKAADKGVSIRYDTKKLPAFSLWKNTDTLKEGYVTGLEPGTSFCYPKAHERAAGRVPKLAPGASETFEMDWKVLRDTAAVDATKKEIAALSDGKPSEVLKTLAFYNKADDPRI